MVLSDKEIRALAVNKGMITPFIDAQTRNGVISYGLSSYGYDFRIADTFKYLPMSIMHWLIPKLRFRIVCGF